MAVARTRWKADAGARTNRLATRIRDQHQLPFDNVDELVLFGMRMPRRRLSAGHDAHEVDAVVFQACVIAETARRALPLRLAERVGIGRSRILDYIISPKHF